MIKLKQPGSGRDNRRSQKSIHAQLILKQVRTVRQKTCVSTDQPSSIGKWNGEGDGLLFFPARHYEYFAAILFTVLEFLRVIRASKVFSRRGPKSFESLIFVRHNQKSSRPP